MVVALWRELRRMVVLYSSTKTSGQRGCPNDSFIAMHTMDTQVKLRGSSRAALVALVNSSRQHCPCPVSLDWPVGAIYYLWVKTGRHFCAGFWPQSFTHEKWMKVVIPTQVGIGENSPRSVAYPVKNPSDDFHVRKWAESGKLRIRDFFLERLSPYTMA